VFAGERNRGCFYKREMGFVFIRGDVERVLLAATACNVSSRDKEFAASKRGGGLGSSTIFKNLMSPTPRRKWYLTTGRRAH